MAERKNVKLIAFVGLSGTGKSSVAEYVSERGVPRVSFANIIANRLESEGLDQTVENERAIRDRLRLDPAGDVVASEIISEINNLIESGQHRIIIDGLGSWDTYKRLHHEFPASLTVVALTARRHIRHRRLTERAENPLTNKQVDERDYDMVENMNKGAVIAMADYFVIDNGSLEQLHSKIDELLRDIEF